MPTCQNNKYKNIIHSQKLLLSNKDETISLLNERIAKLEEGEEIRELKGRIGELKLKLKQRMIELQKYKQSNEQHETTSKRLITAQQMNLRNYAEIRKYKNCISAAADIINEAERQLTFMAKECGTYRYACDKYLPDFINITVKHHLEYSDEFLKKMNEKVEELASE